MAMKMAGGAARYVTRRLSSSGKVLSEEEKAAENIFIKKTEQEKLARKGPKPEEKATSSGGSTADAKPSDGASSTSDVSTGKGLNYGVIAGVVVGAGALGWYFNSSSKKSTVSN
ncbi:hypothetical protein AQUCO_00400179v1 [Aquilegia coerulea]|uniref:Uncharacterized protein n=1 Tax=Aquilegia coerulea TaxID=218851 RepID=A0A2G5ETT4_AQUCA|nr:hypothetical protein AQUCO_00400179v1 [Aquilegia coerulea]